MRTPKLEKHPEDVKNEAPPAVALLTEPATALTKHLQRAADPLYAPKGVIPGEALLPLTLRRRGDYTYLGCFDQRLPLSGLDGRPLTDNDRRLFVICSQLANGDELEVRVFFQTSDDYEDDAIHVTACVTEDGDRPGYPLFPISDDLRAFLTELVRQELAREEV